MTWLQVPSMVQRGDAAAETTSVLFLVIHAICEYEYYMSSSSIFREKIYI